jgi:hypothetical protein
MMTVTDQTLGIIGHQGRFLLAFWEYRVTDIVKQAKHKYTNVGALGCASSRGV